MQKSASVDPNSFSMGADAGACFAGMYGGMPGTGLRGHCDSNNRLPNLVSRPSADELKTPAYVRHTYRHNVVGCGPPYRTTEEKYEESPAWSAFQMLDASMEKADWQRAYSTAAKNRLALRICEKESIRMQRSVSLPRMHRGPPRRQRPKRPRPISHDNFWDEPSPSPEPQSDAPEQSDGNAGGTAIGDAIDLADVTKKEPQVSPSEASPSPSEPEAPPPPPTKGRRKSIGGDDSVGKSASGGKKKRDRVKLTAEKEEPDAHASAE